MPRDSLLSERLETGDRVPIDQTVTIRAFHASRRVRGTMKSQCTGGCGAYLSDDEKAGHRCPGPRRPRIAKKHLKNYKTGYRKAYRKALRAAEKAGKLKEFLAKDWRWP